MRIERTPLSLILGCSLVMAMLFMPSMVQRAEATGTLTVTPTVIPPGGQVTIIWVGGGVVPGETLQLFTTDPVNVGIFGMCFLNVDGVADSTPPESFTDGFTVKFPADFLNVFNAPCSTTALGPYVVNVVDDNSHTHQAVFTVGSQLGLSVDGEPLEGAVSLGQAVQATATPTMPATEATFSWIDPNGNVAREATVPVQSPVSDTFSPNIVGFWTLTVDFHNGQVLTESFNVGFLVVPESPAGVVALIGSSLAAVGGFIFLKRKHDNTRSHSVGDLGI